MEAPKKFMPKDTVRRFTEINGQPGIVAYDHGQVYGVLIVDIAAGRICNLYIVSNPDKLALLPSLPAPPC